jgi:DNA-binding GntR family transcriptional regulator
MTDAVHHEHVAVFDAIRDRDATRARRMAEGHLRQAANRLRLDSLFPASRQTS